MDGKLMSLPMGAPLARILRIALGAALFTILLIVLGSTGASAAPGNAGKTPDKGLVSGILNPVTNLLDQTLQQLPVVNDVTGSNTVGNLVAPVTGATDQLESGLATVPAVGQVLAPVGGITNAVVPPVVGVVDSVVAPTVGAVSQVTAPVVNVAAPILDPVTGAVKPIVEGVTGGAVDVVEVIVPPVVPPAVPDAPGGEVPDANVPGELPGVQLPVVLDPVMLDEAALSSADAAGPADAAAVLDSAVAAQDAATVLGTGAAGQSLPQGALSRYLGASALPTFSTSAGASAGQASAANAPAVAEHCGANGSGDVVGPCAPAAGTLAASGSGSSMTSGASGSFAAADENFWNFLHHAGDAGQLQHADWPLPASMPENPGSTPG